MTTHERMTAEDAEFIEHEFAERGYDAAFIARILATYAERERLRAENAQLAEDRDKVARDCAVCLYEVERLRAENAELRSGAIAWIVDAMADDVTIIKTAVLTDLRAQLAAAQADTARIDWLSKSEIAYSLNDDGTATVFDEDRDYDAATFRAALDAARGEDNG